MKVVFDDGDKLSGIPAENVYTEAEYKVAFGQEPPLPQDEGPAAQGNGDTPVSQVDTPVKLEESGPSVPEEITKRLKVCPGVAAKHSFSGPMSLEELYEKRCGECALCMRQDCEHCSSCLRNSSRTNSRKEVCFQKVGRFG